MTSPFRHGYGPLLFLFLATACAPDRPEASAFQLSDSAGISVAVSTAPAWSDSADAWSIDPTPTLDLAEAGSGPDHEFYRVVDAVSLGDGRIVVANGGASEVRLYAANGELLRTQGGEGDGPGEYRRLMDLAVLPGDSVLVHSWPGRITILEPDLDFARLFDMERRSVQVELLDDSSLVALPMPNVVALYEGRWALERPPLPLVRYGLRGELIDTVGLVPGHEELLFPFGGGFRTGDVMFRRTFTMDAADDRIVTGAAERMEVEVWDATGAPRLVARVPGYPLALTDSLVERELAAWRALDPSPSMEAMIEAQPDRSRLPAYSGLLMDASGGWWARPHVGLAGAQDAKEWQVFDAEGRWLGGVTVPPGFEPMEIGADHVLGVRTDELDVETVQVLRLNRD